MENSPDSDTYRTLREPATGSLRDRGSRFMAFAHPVTTEEEIQQLLARIKKEHHDANHHCYAWALGQDRMPFRVNDDGEPSGSAGKPIFGQILSKDLTDVLIVVVRYFGGTKLGIPGLIKAYRGAAMNALDQAVIITRTIMVTYEIRCTYPVLHQVMHVIKEENLGQEEISLGISCRLIVRVRKNRTKIIHEKLNSIKGVETITR